MTDVKGHVVSCPTCKEETLYRADNPFRPFCSERCRLIDLGEWADEGHRIPGQPATSEFNKLEIDTH